VLVKAFWLRKMKRKITKCMNIPKGFNMKVRSTAGMLDVQEIFNA
jgi:hypothetical protein